VSLSKTTARYAFSLFVLGVIFYLFDANDVLAGIVKADVGNVMTAVCFALSSQVISAIRLNRLLLLQDISLPLGRLVLIGLSAVFYGLVVPGGTLATFAVRFTQLAQDAKVESVAAALIADRFIATAFLIVIGAVAIAFDQADMLWAGVIVAGIIFSGGVLVFGRRFVLRFIDVLDSASIHGPSNRLHGVSRKIRAVLLKYSAARSAPMVVVLVASLLAHLSGCMMYFTIATGMGLGISFFSICWIRSGMILSTMIPMSVGGLGLREVAAIGLFVPLGLGETKAVGFSMLVFLVTPLIVGLIGGSGELFRGQGWRKSE
jgi:uncharacterized protein (TIRG00374 family)